MPIDLRHVLKDLYSQRERLEHVITSLGVAAEFGSGGCLSRRRPIEVGNQWAPRSGAKYQSV
jgi:hypothetical protein